MQLGGTGMNPLTFGVGGEKKEITLAKWGKEKASSIDHPSPY
jgi:hypothetical protein